MGLLTFNCESMRARRDGHCKTACSFPTRLEALWGDLASLNRKENESESLKSPAIAAATNALGEMFSAACSGGPIDSAEIVSGGESLISFIESQGLATWIDVVRKHHSATFRHCLLVTGLAVGFGQAIGVSRLDRQRLSLAGMLHDVGKARIPLSILEKPGSLDDEELSVMRRHTELGLDALQTTPGLPDEMLDMANITMSTSTDRAIHMV